MDAGWSGSRTARASILALAALCLIGGAMNSEKLLGSPLLRRPQMLAFLQSPEPEESMVAIFAVATSSPTAARLVVNSSPPIASDFATSSTSVSASWSTPLLNLTLAVTTPTPSLTSSSTTPTPSLTSLSTTPMPSLTSSSTAPTPSLTSSSTTPMPSLTSSSTTPTPSLTSSSTSLTPSLTSSSTTPTPSLTSSSTTPTPSLTSSSTTSMISLPSLSTMSTTSLPHSSLPSEANRVQTIQLVNVTPDAAEAAFPSMFSLTNDPVFTRGKTKCPAEIRVSEWNGRMGNHYFQVSQAIVAALLCHTSRVTFPAHVNKSKSAYQAQDGMLEMSLEVLLDVDTSREYSVPDLCPISWSHKWYHMHCKRVPAWQHRQVMLTYLRPKLGASLLQAESRPFSTFEEGKLLTVHLRADDIRQYPRYEWGQPPCSMYQKIIAEHNYTSVMVVEKGRMCACESLFESLNAAKRVKVQRSDGKSVVEDFAQMMRAQNFVLSFSSFAISAAMLSKQIRVMYRRRDAMWDGILHSILNCNVWPGVVMYEFNTTLQTDGRKDSPREWLQNFKLEDLQGPYTCSFGSSILPGF
ncbi:unnamed protein product [Effrenium voratum]|nr:unnamed protein product [Effrenium voratum]